MCLVRAGDGDGPEDFDPLDDDEDPFDNPVGAAFEDEATPRPEKKLSVKGTSQPAVGALNLH